MSPKERADLLWWAKQSLFLAMNERRSGGVVEMLEQMEMTAVAQGERFMAAAEAEAARPGDVPLLLAKKVFDWVAAYRQGNG